MGDTVYGWLTRQYAAYAALPPPVRAGIERVVHFVGIFLLGVIGGLAAGIPWKQVLLAALLPAGGGQYSLHHQLPRDARCYQERAYDGSKRSRSPVLDEDTLH